MIDDPEEFAWQQLEAKQNKAKSTPITDRLALQVAHNALSAIDRETPYPIAKHSLMVINEVLSRPVQDWEAIAADQAMTIAMLRDDLRQALAQTEQEPVAWMFEGNKPIKVYAAPPSKPWVSLTDEDIWEIKQNSHQSYTTNVWVEETDTRSGYYKEVERYTESPVTFARAIEAKLKELNNG